MGGQPATVILVVSIIAICSVFQRSATLVSVSQAVIVQRVANGGKYRTEVSNRDSRQKYQSFTLHEVKSGEDSVMLREENNLDDIDVRRNVNGIMPPIDIVIEYESYPANITYYWVTKTGINITEGHHMKYETSHNDTHVKLRINDPTVYDTGNYTLFVMAGNAIKTLRMGVNVFAKPIVQMESKFAKPNEKVSFRCKSIGYPRPDISFAFVPCLSYPGKSCSMSTSASTKWVTPSGFDETLIFKARTYTRNATEPGVVYCKATNIEGSEVTQADLLISDLPNAITLVKESPNETITVGDHVTIVCSALVYNYTNDITFLHNGKELQASDGVSHSYSPKQYAWQARLDIKNVTKDHKGPIYCQVKTTYLVLSYRKFQVDVLDPVAPMLLSGKSNETLSVDLQGQLKLQCDVIGTPDPKIVWLKDGKLVQPVENNTRVKLIKTTLIFENLQKKDLGVFECHAENKKGTIKKYWKVDERSKTDLGKFLIYINLGLFVALFLGIVLVSMFYCKKKKEVKAMKEVSIETFDEGNIGCYKPALTLDKQADQLPYNDKYEFPKERLKLGKQLGTGAFGVVVKATATRIIENEDETTVAVKMVKKVIDNELMRTLVSELKIMVHLGKHLNVVNLLGAVTKNIAERELMVIVEYCRFGNVQNFLVKHRPYFIDQINQKTGEIDSSIDEKMRRRSTCGYRYNRGLLLQPMEDLNTDYSNEPLWSSSYGRNRKGPSRFVNTTDLVCWASQIACGMEYLASRNVMHGDLAARNILLCDDNVVKICDFGLARSLYKRQNYKKKGKEPLPFKWLALECHSDHVFSTYSDVWAYGIVLWELFSLGKVPYPGMEPNQELYNKVRDGYRMDKPQYSNQDIYNIMLSCWNETPYLRPSFTDLNSRFDAMLPDDMRDHFRELNNPYLQMNAENMKRGNTDYLALLGPPEEPAPTAPNNVNSFIVPFPPIAQIDNDNDYLDMSRAKSEPEDSLTIHSNVNCDPPNSSKWRKNRGLPEEITELDGSVADGLNSDSETEAISPIPRERNHKPGLDYINVKNHKFGDGSGQALLSEDEVTQMVVTQGAITYPG